MDDNYNFIGHPEQCKLDWIVEAVTEGIMTECEFKTLFECMETVEKVMSVC